MIDQLKISEVLNTFRDYQILLNQIAVVLISSAGILTFKNRRLAKRNIPVILSASALVLGILNLLLGLAFRSRLVDVTLGLGFDQKPASLTDATLKSLTYWQVGLLALGAILLIVAAAKTPRDYNRKSESV